MTKLPLASDLASATTLPRSTSATVLLGLLRPASRASPLGSTRTMSNEGGVAASIRGASTGFDPVDGCGTPSSFAVGFDAVARSRGVA